MTENNIEHRRGYSLLFFLMSIISILVISISAIFTFLLVDHRIKDTIDRADSKLLTAVEFNREIIGPDYHDRIKDEKSVSRDQFISIVSKNDELCRRLNIQYLWSLLKIGDDLVFTSATHSDLNNTDSPCAAFFEKHNDPESFRPALIQETIPSFSSFHNEWGEGRQVLISRKDAHGRIYIFGASVELIELDKVVHRTIIQSIAIGLGIIISSFFIALFVTRAFTATFANFIKAADQMANGDLDVYIPAVGTAEMQSLFFSIEKMRKGLKLHITELMESEQKYRLLHESAGVGIGYYTTEGVIISFNRIASQHMDKEPEYFIGKLIFDIYPKDDAEIYMGRIKKAAELETPQEYEDMILLPSEIKWFHSTFARIIDPSGRVIGIQIISNDISGLKKMEEKNQSLLAEKELLLSEVHHRIKNNMSTIKGLLTLQHSAENNPSTAASLRDAENRIQSMIVLYDRLYCTYNFRELAVKDYLMELTEDIIGSFPDRDKVKVISMIGDFILNVNYLTTIGIILNEMLSNIMKYAFPGKDNGIINLSVMQSGNQISMIVQDNGIGIPESVNFETSTGFGMQLIWMLTEQIGGNINIERGNGTKIILEFTAE